MEPDEHRRLRRQPYSRAERTAENGPPDEPHAEVAAFDRAAETASERAEMMPSETETEPEHEPPGLVRRFMPAALPAFVTGHPRAAVAAGTGVVLLAGVSAYMIFSGPAGGGLAPVAAPGAATQPDSSATTSATSPPPALSEVRPSPTTIHPTRLGSRKSQSAKPPRKSRSPDDASPREPGPGPDRNPPRPDPPRTSSPPRPALAVSPSSAMSLGGGSGVRTGTIRLSASGATVSWNASVSGSDRMSISSTSGSLSAGQSTQITVKCGSMVQGCGSGTSGTVSISSNGGNATISVTN